MRPKISLLAMTGVLCWAAFAQGQKGPGQRPELQLALQQLFPLTTIGEGVLGLRGSPDSIRQAGVVVVLRQEGVSGSVERKDAAVLNIGLEAAPLASGRKDFSFHAGDRFYVHSIYVGSDVITFGLMTTQLVPVGGKPQRLWSTLNFFFKVETLHNGDRESVVAAVQQWLAPESLGSITAAAAAPAVAVAVPGSAPANAEIQLTPGMSAEKAVESMGNPLRRIRFESHMWLYYPGLILTFTGEKLASVDRIGGPPAQVTIESDPSHAEIWVDGKFAGETPAMLEIPAGKRAIAVRKSGSPEWSRELELFAGSTVSLTANLGKTK